MDSDDEASKVTPTQTYVGILGLGAIFAIVFVAVHGWPNLDPVASSGVAVALITLFAVFRQIEIANKQLAQADEQLGYARRELKAVEEDLAYSRAVVEDIKRKAYLVLTGWPETVPSAMRTGGFEAKLSVSNLGNKGAVGFKLILAVPPGWVPLHSQHVVTILSPGEFTDYVLYETLYNESCFPSDSVKVDVRLLPVRDLEPRYNYDGLKQLYWRISHEDGVRPNPENYLELYELWGIYTPKNPTRILGAGQSVPAFGQRPNGK